MPSVYIQTPGFRVGLKSEKLRVESPDTGDPDLPPIVKEVLLSDVEQVIASEHVHFSLPAIAECMRRNIPFILTGSGERILGVCRPPSPNHKARLSQYQRFLEPAFALALAINWVEAKILNSRRVLQRLAANRDAIEITRELLNLGELAKKCTSVTNPDSLRGIEGAAAGKYFELYGSFYPESCPFERRSRRPPHNAPNAILSYAYTLLAAEAECALHAIALDPAIGFYHEPDDNRAALALDMIEPFRAPLADAMAIDLMSHATLHPKNHFENREGGVYMNNDGKKRFFVAYEKRMEREFTSEQTGIRTSIRGELRRQAMALKKAIVSGDPFEPFLMN